MNIPTIHPRTTPTADIGQLLGRIALGVTMVAHGLQKLDQGGLGATAEGFEAMGIPAAGAEAVPGDAQMLLRGVGGRHHGRRPGRLRRVPREATPGVHGSPVTAGGASTSAPAQGRSCRTRVSASQVVMRSSSQPQSTPAS